MKNIDELNLTLKLKNIDFFMVRNKLCQPQDNGGFDWDLALADEAIALYLGFLTAVATDVHQQQTNLLYPKHTKLLFEKFVPPENRRHVAVVWETHILNTRQYLEDCQRIFNCYLHYAYNPLLQLERI